LPQTFVNADAELHLSGAKATDHQIQVLRYPVAELGEIDSTFRKSDISSLKSFLSRARDHIREPYEAKSTARLRNTVFVGTVNNVQFLNDPTGTRRFWPVDVTGPITWDHGIDLQQLWAQVNEMWCAGDEWNLTPTEDKLRVHTSWDFVSLSPEVDMVSAQWELYSGDSSNMAVMNKTEIMTISGVRNIHRAAGNDVTEWLIKVLGKSKKMGERQNCWLFPIGLSGQRAPHLTPASPEMVLRHGRGRVK
jgi:putative DNA primase/helicase